MWRTMKREASGFLVFPFKNYGCTLECLGRLSSSYQLSAEKLLFSSLESVVNVRLLKPDI